MFVLVPTGKLLTERVQPNCPVSVPAGMELATEFVVTVQAGKRPVVASGGPNPLIYLSSLVSFGVPSSSLIVALSETGNGLSAPYV